MSEIKLQPIVYLVGGKIFTSAFETAFNYLKGSDWQTGEAFREGDGLLYNFQVCNCGEKDCRGRLFYGKHFTKPVHIIN
jgi:maltoporin